MGGYAPLAVAVGDGSGATLLNWVHGNHMGVPLIISDASGSPAPAADYAAPGFPGQSRTLADLYYNRYRDYDPTTGRYIQADPIGLAGDINPYAYAMGNPLRYSDPLGLATASEVAEFAFEWWLERQVKRAATRRIPIVGQALSIGDAIGAAAAVGEYLCNQAPTLEMAQNNKQRRLRISSLQSRIDEHRQKLDNDPDSRDANHWRTEIKAWNDTIQRLQGRLPNGN